MYGAYNRDTRGHPHRTMPAERLPETLQTLYAELLDQALHAEAEAAAARLPPPGAFVSKEVRGGTYWYLQRSEGARKRQVYLGADSPALRTWMQEVRERRTERGPDEERRGEIVAMLAAGGAFREPAAVGKVLEILAASGVFRLGGVLVGTQAFSAYGNMLGVRFASRSLRTEDVDLAQERDIAVALDRSAAPFDLEAALRRAEPPFLVVPPFDPRSTSTSFKVRGRDLRVDLLTPQRRGEERPVALPLLGAAAQPLPFLGYLLVEPQPAIVLQGSGVLVQVPSPARFAFHKLWLAFQRPAAQQAKAAKDRRQAEQILELLAIDRPYDLAPAWAAIDDRRRRVVRPAVERLEQSLRDKVLDAV
jgi:hypothetical protein